MKQNSIQWLNQTIEEITQSDKGLIEFFKDGKFFKAYDLKDAVDGDTYSEIVVAYNRYNGGISSATHFVKYPIITVGHVGPYQHILLTDEQVAPPNDPITVIHFNEVTGQRTFTENYTCLSESEISSSNHCYYQLPIYNIVKVDNKKYIAMKVYISKYTSPKHVNGDTLTDGLQHEFVTLDFKHPYSHPDVMTLLGMEYNVEVSMYKPADCKPIPLKGLSLVIRPNQSSPYVFSL